LGKNISKEQVETITQKIRQNQRDLIKAKLGKTTNDKIKHQVLARVREGKETVVAIAQDSCSEYRSFYRW
jgi:hypothetical protein